MRLPAPIDRALAFLAERVGRRMIFSLMFFAVALPILFPVRFADRQSEMTRRAFDAIEALPEGSKVLVSFDFDPSSEGELQPMANSFLHHLASRRHKLYFLALWPLGEAKARETIEKVLRRHHPDYRYGEDYVELGFKAGNQAVIRVATTDLRRLFPTDNRGTPLDRIPMMRGVDNLQAMDLVVSISAGFPGSKEWAQYLVAAYPDERVVTGTTGVQAVTLFPYVPQQIVGMLGAIKGAAEYEALVNERFPGPDGEPLPDLLEGTRRMGPQLTAHLLMMALIILGNLIHLSQRRRGSATGGAR